MRSFINSAELNALRGLPHEARTLYREGIRAWMDFLTGIAGISRTLSYQQFSELLEVQPERGSTRPGYRPTRAAMRAMIARLERAGLLEVRGEQRGGMVFFLPLADKGAIRPNEEQHQQRQDEQQGKPQQRRGMRGDERHGQQQEERHTSEYSSEYISETNTHTGTVRSFVEVDIAKQAKWLDEQCPSLTLDDIVIEHQKLLERNPSKAGNLRHWRIWMLNAELNRSKRRPGRAGK